MTLTAKPKGVLSGFSEKWAVDEGEGPGADSRESGAKHEIREKKSVSSKTRNQTESPRRIPMRFNRMTWMAAVLGTVGVTGMVGCGKDKQAMTGKGSASIQATIKLAATDVHSVCVTVSGGVPTPLANPITVPLTGSGLQYSAIVSSLPVGSYTFNGGAYASTDCSGTALYANATAATATVNQNQTATVVLNLNQVDAPVGLYNEAPIIDSLTASALTIATNGTATITVTGHDPDAGQTAGIKWSWSSSCGTLAPTTGLGGTPAAVTFTAPATDSTCQVNIQATDAIDPSLVNNASLTITVGAATATGNSKIVANLNTCPVMTKLTASNLPIKVNYVAPDMLTLSTNATDSDGDAVTYLWSIVPNAVGTPNAGQSCVGSFGDVTAKDTTFTLTSTTMAECTFAVAVSDGKFADGTTPKCTVSNHLSLPVGTSGVTVATGAPVLGFDYQSSPTIDNGQKVSFAMQVKGGCDGGTINTSWSSTIGTVTTTTPVAIGLGLTPYTDAAFIMGTSGNPPAPVVTFTAACAIDPTKVATHTFQPTALNDSCNGQPDGTDCTATAHNTNQCVLGATCQAGACVPTAGQVKTCSASTTACQDNKCDPADGACKLVAASDGPSPTMCTDKCTSQSCSAGACSTAQTVTCTNSACSTGSCNAATGACVNTPAPSTTLCSDALFCSVNDHCDGAGACVGGGAFTCPATQICDETAQGCVDKPIQICSKAQWDKDLSPVVYGVSAAPDGAVWTTGAMFGSYDFGTGRTLTACSSDAYLTKFATDGTALQSWSFGDANVPCYDQNAKGVAVASNGNVGVIGTFKAEIAFTALGNGGVIGKDYLGATGNFSYYAIVDGSSAGTDPTIVNAQMTTLGTTGALTAIGSNPTKNTVAVCGTTNGAVPLFSATSRKGLAFPTVGVAGGANDIVVAVIDTTTGNVVWGKQIGGPGDQTCNSVTVDYNGDVVISGMYNGTLNFGGATTAFPSVSGANLLYVAKLAGSNGAAIAAKTWGTQGTVKGAVAVDASNNIAVAGQMTNVGTAGITFGTGISVPYVGGLDAFLLKMDSSLTPTCAFADGDTYDQVATAVGFDSLGNMYVGGGFISAMPALSLSQTSITNFDAFEVQFNGTCAPQCIKSYGDVGGTQQIGYLTVANGASVPAAAKNSIYVAGAYSSVMSFDTTPVTTLDTGSVSNIHNFAARLMP